MTERSKKEIRSDLYLNPEVAKWIDELQAKIDEQAALIVLLEGNSNE